MKLSRPCRRALCRFGMAAILVVSAGICPVAAQDGEPLVPRAVPVEPLTPRAVPFEEVEPVPVSTPPPEPTPTPASNGEEEIRLAPAESAANRSPEEVLFDLANGLYTRKNYEYAAAEYEKLLGNYHGGPIRQPAMFRLAECYRVLGRKEQARNLYERILIDYGQGEFVGPAAFRLATLYYNVGNAREALPLFQQSASMANAKEIKLASRYYEAKCLELLERNVETMEVYRELLTVEKDNPYLEASRRAFADKALNYGRLTDALEQFEVLMKTSDKPEVRLEAALKAASVARQLAQTDKAIAYYETALRETEPGAVRNAAQIEYFQLLAEAGQSDKLLAEFTARRESMAPEALPDILLLVADTQRVGKNYADAAETYALLQRDYPRSDSAQEAQFQELVALFYQGGDGLEKKIKEYLASNPPAKRKALARLMQAEAHFQKEDWRSAGAIYADLLDADLPPKQRAELLFKLGWCYGKIDNYERVTEVLSDYVEEYPDHPLMPKALTQRALAYKSLQRFDEALLDFTRVLANFPESPERVAALQQKALLLGQQGDNPGMIKHFRQFLDENPEGTSAAQAHYWTGWAYFELKDFANAIPYLEKARELNPEEYGPRASLRLLLSQYYLENVPGLIKEVDAYQAAAYEPPVQLEVLRYLGNKTLEQGETAKAERYLSAALAQSTEDAELTQLLGRVQMEAGQPAKAAETLAKYLESVKESVPRSQGLLLLGRAQLQATQPDAARKSALAILELQPQGRLNAEGRILLGEVEMAEQDYQAAAKSFLSVAVLYEDVRLTPRALDLAIQAYEKLGNRSESERLTNELRTRYPDYRRQ